MMKKLLSIMTGLILFWGCNNFHTIIHEERGVCSGGEETVYISNTSKNKEVLATIKVGQRDAFDNPKFFYTQERRISPGEKTSMEVWCGSKVSVIGEIEK